MLDRAIFGIGGLLLLGGTIWFTAKNIAKTINEPTPNAEHLRTLQSRFPEVIAHDAKNLKIESVVLDPPTWIVSYDTLTPVSQFGGRGWSPLMSEGRFMFSLNEGQQAVVYFSEPRNHVISAVAAGSSNFPLKPYLPKLRKRLETYSK